MTDDEIDEMFAEQYGEREGRHGMATGIVDPQTPPVQQAEGGFNGLPVYPLALAQVPPMQPATDGLLTRRLGPLPVWGWGLIALGTGVGGYFLWQQTGTKKVSANDDEDDDERSSRPALPSGEGSGGWRTSRGDFAQHLKSYFMRKGMGDKVYIFDDADEAKKKLPEVSPLVNLTCKVPYKVDKELEKLCKREGLQPLTHADGTVGFYPAKSKRGKAWEEYVDLLRDDGQKA